MTNPSLTCEQFADHLADLLEHDADERTRAAVEAHALACADCGPLLADLRRLRTAAANLPVLEPSRDLWAGIAERIETPVVAIGSTGSTSTSRRRLAPLWYGLAAAALVGVTATVTHELTRRATLVGAPLVQSTQVAAAAPRKADTAAAVTPAPALAPVPAPVEQPASASPRTPDRAVVTAVSNAPAKRTAEQTYDAEIANLRTVLKRRRPDLDSSTVATVEHNLHVIDDAIAQCRQALRKDPASRFLMESLNDAMDSKVQLLRTAAVLPSKA